MYTRDVIYSQREEDYAQHTARRDLLFLFVVLGINTTKLRGGHKTKFVIFENLYFANVTICILFHSLR